MLKYNRIIFLLLVSVFIFVQSCQSSSSPSKVAVADQNSIVRINIKDEPQNLDPRKARDLNAMILTKMLFEGLTRLNKEGVVELGLANKVEISEDQRIYTFFLKEGYWSNADLATAFDFEYAWKKCLSPSFASDTAFQMYVIKNAQLAKKGEVSVNEVGVLALDEQTLQVELENPTPYFLNLLASAPFFPVNRKIDEENPMWAENAATFVSNGPFSLNDWKHQSHLDLKKNDFYWDKDHVRLSGIQLVMVQEDTELMLFEKNELDWAGSPLSTLPVEAIRDLKKNANLQTKEALGTYFLRSNTQKAPFDNVKMRKAFALAIDRSAIVEHVTQGNQIPATGLVPSVFGLSKEPYFQDANAADARKLFEEALSESKMELDAFPQVTLMYRALERNHLIAQALQQQWFKAFGIRVALEALEGKVYFDRISHQDYQLASGSWIADFEDPINFLEVFKHSLSGSNNTFWENEAYASILDQSMLELDPAKRQELLASAEKILIDEMPIIPIFYYTMLYVSRSDIKDVVLSNCGQLDFKWAYFDKGDQHHVVQREGK